MVCNPPDPFNQKKRCKKLKKVIIVSMFFASFFIAVSSRAKARDYSDDVVKGSNFGSFGDLRETPDLNENGDPKRNDDGSIVMRPATKEDIQKQIYKKLSGKLGLRKIKDIRVEEEKVFVEIVEKTGAPFYTMVLDRDAGKEKRMITFDNMYERKQKRVEKAKQEYARRKSFYQSYLENVNK